MKFLLKNSDWIYWSQTYGNCGVELNNLFTVCHSFKTEMGIRLMSVRVSKLKKGLKVNQL